MNTLDRQIKGVIESSISRTMNIKLPLQSNDEERNLLLHIIKEQEEQRNNIRALRMAFEQLRSDIMVIVHHN
jgi:hypothetical protein